MNSGAWEGVEQERVAGIQMPEGQRPGCTEELGFGCYEDWGARQANRGAAV